MTAIMRKKLKRSVPSMPVAAGHTEFVQPRAHKSKTVADSLPEIQWDGNLTNSARSTFLDCRKKFEWSYLRRLSPRTPSLPFLVGGLVHNGLERMYKMGRFDEDAERKIVRAECDKAAKTAGLTAKMSDKIYSQAAMVMGILKGYSMHYLAKDLVKWEVLEAEASFSYSLPNGWRAMGKRDMVVREKKNGKPDPGGKVCLVEHKTAATIDASYVAKLPLDAQIIGYANSLMKKMGKLPDKVVYNVIKKVGIKQKQTESFNSYLKRVEDEYTREPENYFYRETIQFSKEDIQNFEKELFTFAREMERAIKEGFYYKNTQSCTRMGICPFMQMCIAGPTKENLMHFRVRSAVHEELVDQKDDGGMR